MERLLFGEPLHTAGECEFPGLKGALQSGGELAAEYAAQHLYRAGRKGNAGVSSAGDRTRVRRRGPRNGYADGSADSAPRYAER